MLLFLHAFFQASTLLPADDAGDCNGSAGSNGRGVVVLVVVGLVQVVEVVVNWLWSGVIEYLWSSDSGRQLLLQRAASVYECFSSYKTLEVLCNLLAVLQNDFECYGGSGGCGCHGLMASASITLLVILRSSCWLLRQ